MQHLFFKKYLFKLEDNYNIVMIFAIDQYESAMGIHVSPYPEPPSHLPTHPIPLDCPRLLDLGALLPA